MKTLQDFSKVIDRQMVVLTVLALLAVYLSRQFDLTVDLPISLVGIAVVFPLVFSINSAYRRREEALRYFASLKAYAIALYYAHRDWPPTETDSPERALALLQRLIRGICDHFTAQNSPQSSTFRAIYATFSEFSQSHERLRTAGVPANEISRANQYLKAMMVEFERMSNLLYYRTPVALRAHSRLFLNIFPIVCGPYFANIGYPQHPAVGFLVALFYTVVLVSLDNIQDQLENPFDGLGADDLRLDIVDEYASLITDLYPAPHSDEQAAEEPAGLASISVKT